MARNKSIFPRTHKHRQYRSVADTKKKLKLKSDDSHLPLVPCSNVECPAQFANEAGMKNHARYHVEPQNPGFERLKRQNPGAALEGYRFRCGVCHSRRTKTKPSMREHYKRIHGWIPAAEVDYLIMRPSRARRPAPAPAPPPLPPQVKSIKKNKRTVVKCSCGDFSGAWNKTLIEAHVKAHTPEHANASFVFVLDGEEESTTFQELMHSDAPLPRITKH